MKTWRERGQEQREWCEQQAHGLTNAAAAEELRAMASRKDMSSRERGVLEIVARRIVNMERAMVWDAIAKNEHVAV